MLSGGLAPSASFVRRAATPSAFASTARRGWCGSTGPTAGSYYIIGGHKAARTTLIRLSVQASQDVHRVLTSPTAKPRRSPRSLPVLSRGLDSDPRFSNGMRPECEVPNRLRAGGNWIRTFSSAILIMLCRPAFLRRISARLSKELDGFQRTPRSSRAPVDSNSVTSGLAGFDPVLRAPLPQSRLLGLVREIVPPFEGAPSHQQLLISAVSTSSAEDVANFVVVVG
jgi:hypothetical protein